MLKLRHFYFAFISSILLSTATSLLPQENANFGFLKIVGTTDSLQILINGNPMTVAAGVPLKLKTGNCTITVINPNRYSWGHFDWQQEISISPADTLTLEPEFSDIVFVRSFPSGAEIFINQEFKGTTPLTFFPNPAQQSVIMLKKKGYQDQLIQLNGKTNLFNVNLVKDEAIFCQQKSKLLASQKKKANYRKATIGFWTLSLVSGIATIYYKNLANENYDKYLTAGSLKAMNHYYDRTIMFDNYTNVSLGLFQGCCFLSFYFLMKSFN